MRGAELLCSSLRAKRKYKRGQAGSAGRDRYDRDVDALLYEETAREGK